MDNFNPVLYTIRPNDTLYSIAMQYGTTAQEIMQTNSGLDPYNLRVGQQIYIYVRDNPNSYWVSRPHVNLLENMNLVWLEHIFWTRLLLISIADNLADVNFTRARLLQNPRNIADVFRRYYGNSIANTLQQLLTEHLSIGNDLIIASKNGNSKLASELNKRWYQNADEMAKLFSSMSPFYPEEMMRQMLYDHLKLTSNEVDARLRKDYTADIKAYELVQREVLKMSHFFVDGIVKQFPNMF